MCEDNESRRNSSCTGKHRHETFIAAKKQLENSKQRKNSIHHRKVRMVVYLCDFCGFYHIGHNTKAKGSNL